MDMQRLLHQTGSDVTYASFSDSWVKLWSQRILKQAEAESSNNRRLKSTLTSLKLELGIAIYAP